MPNATHSPSPGRVRAVLLIVLGVLIAGHAVQSWSFLRLNYDSVLLLKMVEARTAGRGWNPPDVGSQHPIGYPALVLGLERAGMAHPGVLVGINVAALAIGVWACAGVLRRGFPGMAGRGGILVLVLTAGSWVMVKHSALVVTDLVFFALSSLALLALVRAWGDDLSEPGSRGDPPARTGAHVAWLAVGAVLIAAAILTRTIGVALLPALAWAAIGPRHRVDALARTIIANRALVAACGGGLVALAGGFFLLLMRSSYWEGFLKEGGDWTWIEAARNTLVFRLTDLGQVLLNVNAGSVPARLQAVLWAAGLAGYAVLAIGLWHLRRMLSPATVYLATYGAILTIWPFADPRFLLPVLPLLGGVIAAALPAWWHTRAGAALAWAYAVVFMGLGATALGVSTRLTFAGERFPDGFGSGIYREAYRAAMGQGYDPGALDEDAYRLLMRFEPRARAARNGNAGQAGSANR